VKLGADEKIAPCRIQLEYCLTEWANRLLQEKENNLRVLSQECVMALHMDLMNYDFSNHLKKRNTMEANQLSEIIIRSGGTM
jgi:hypothetical protein